jgi:hypothetical protein
MNELEKTWTDLHYYNKTLSIESISGVGSTLRYTENLRTQLPNLIKELSIKSILDAPCGDMNWMSVFLENNNKLLYTGGDIVKPLILDNIKKYKQDNINFIQLDITKDLLPDVDLWICRDCWFHLSYNSISLALENFKRSNIKYILTTTHINTGFTNSNIDDGEFRLIDLFSHPFNFPTTPLYKITDWINEKGHFPREMILFSVDQLKTIKVGYNK